MMKKPMVMVVMEMVEMVVVTVAVEMVVDIYKSAYSDKNDYKTVS